MAMEKIEGNDDILMNILVRLPPKSIFKFKVVSNRWNNILTNTYFLKTYTARRKKEPVCGGDNKRLLAFIQTPHPPPNDHPPSMNVLHVDQENFVKNIPSILGYFIHSSNGLILCGAHPRTYFVVNPVTKKWASLPPPPRIYRKYPTMALVCEEDNASELVPNYKIVSVTTQVPQNYLRVQTYSSKTRKWVVSKVRCEDFLFIYNRRLPLVSNGVVHWFSTAWHFVLYDSSKDHFNSSRKNRLQLIKFPYVDIPDEDGPWSITRSSSNDVLWFSMIYKKKKSMGFWMLPKGEDGSYMRYTTIRGKEWILMHTFGYDFLCKLNNFKIASNFFTLEALIPWDTTFVAAVLKFEDKIYIYNLKSKSIKLVIQDSSVVDTKYYPFMESLSLSSYVQLDNVCY